jgi:anti-sigma regulatory factor (Ser/Thr protein kinase)
MVISASRNCSGVLANLGFTAYRSIDMILTPAFQTDTTAPAAAPAAVRAPMLAVLPGTPQSVSAARRMARDLLGDDHPATETTMLLVSELVTNSLMHSKSGAPGGVVTVVLCSGPAGVLVQVSDSGGPSEPCLSPGTADDDEHGFGLLLVDVLAERWGSICSPEGRVTWCRVGGPGFAHAVWPRPADSVDPAG